jgi:hypothetical protein
MLVRGTRDDSYVVRTRAVELLGPPQHGPAALEALIGTLREHDEEMARWIEERGKLDLDPIDRNPTGKQLEKRKAQTAELAALNERHELTRAWGGTIAVQLGHFPDDAAVTAILASSWAQAAPGAQRSLLALGSAAAVRGAVEHLGGVQAAYARRPDALRDDAEQEQALRALHADLAAFASARGLPAPAWDPAPAEAWTRWLAEHAGGFPEHLPGVRSPAW